MVQGVALLLALTLDAVPAVPTWIPDVVLLGSLAALLWSFGKQSLWQVGQARAARGQLGPTTKP